MANSDTRPDDENNCGISVVVPVYNEHESLRELAERLTAVLTDVGDPYEVIFVDDGSTDESFDVLSGINDQDNRFKVVQLRKHFGKSPALLAGFLDAKGRIVATLDSDLQDFPEELPQLIDVVREGELDLVCGRRARRSDRVFKRIGSRLFNVASAVLTGVNIRDANTGMKAMRQEVAKEVTLYGELHRFLPALAAWRGFSVGEVSVRHGTRKYGRSKYGPGKAVKGFLDLLTVAFLMRFARSPAHLFGTIGLVLGAGGLGIDIFIAYLRLATGSIQGRYPLLALGLLMSLMGVQFLSLGLLAEMIAYGRRGRTAIHVKRRLS